MSDMTADFAEFMDRHPELGAALDRMAGTAPQSFWECEDGYVIMRTTSRVSGGRHDGKWLLKVYKPVGKGARSGKATEHVCCYTRAFATRKAMLRRGDVLYRQHSPKWDRKHLT